MSMVNKRWKMESGRFVFTNVTSGHCRKRMKKTCFTRRCVAMVGAIEVNTNPWSITAKVVLLWVLLKLITELVSPRQ